MLEDAELGPPLEELGPPIAEFILRGVPALEDEYAEDEDAEDKDGNADDRTGAPNAAGS